MVLMRQSHRSKLVVTMLSAVLLLLAANPVWVQERPDPDELKIVYIAGARNNANDPLRLQTFFSNLYLVAYAGSHSVALVADDGIVLVDTKGQGLGKAVQNKLRLAGDVPVSIIINTSARGGVANDEFPSAVQVIAHENTKAALTKLNPASVPTKTFTDTFSLTVPVAGEPEGTDRIDLYYFGPGHSGGDTIAVFPSYGVAVFGDLFPGKTIPVIDASSGGSALALPETLQKAWEGLQDKRVDVIIPGRGEAPYKVVLSWITIRDLKEYADFMSDFVDAAKDAQAAGQSIDEAVSSVTSTIKAKYSGYDFLQARGYVESIYAELVQ